MPYYILLQVGSVLAAAGRFSGDVHNIRRSSFDREEGVLSLEFKDGAKNASRNASGLLIGNFLHSVQSGAHRVVRNATRRSHGDSRSKDGSTASGRKPEEASEAEAASEAPGSVSASASASATASEDSMQARINFIRGTTVRRIKHVQCFLREKGTANTAAAPGTAGQAAGGNKRLAGSLTRTSTMNFFKQVWLIAYLALTVALTMTLGP